MLLRPPEDRVQPLSQFVLAVIGLFTGLPVPARSVPALAACLADLESCGQCVGEHRVTCSFAGLMRCAQYLGHLLVLTRVEQLACCLAIDRVYLWTPRVFPALGHAMECSRDPALEISVFHRISPRCLNPSIRMRLEVMVGR